MCAQRPHDLVEKDAEGVHVNFERVVYLLVQVTIWTIRRESARVPEAHLHKIAIIRTYINRHRSCTAFTSATLMPSLQISGAMYAGVPT